MPRPSLNTGNLIAIGPALPAAASAAPSAFGSSSVAASAGSATSVPVARSSRAIESLLEGLRADAPPGVEESLSVAALSQIGLDDGVDRLRHGFGAEARADDRADRSIVLRVAAERNLIELSAFLIDTENADIAGVVMPQALMQPDLLRRSGPINS